MRLNKRIGFIGSMKPRNRRVAQKRLTGEKKSSECDKMKDDLPVNRKNTYGGFIYEKETIDTNRSAHTKWNGKYRIVFAPKYRRNVLYEEKRLEIRERLRRRCQWKGVEIIEEVSPEHIHMPVSIPPKMKDPPAGRMDLYDRRKKPFKSFY